MVVPASRDRKAEIEARFGASAQEYALSPGHRGGPDLDRMLDLAAPTAADTMLDLATGAGNTALAFAPRVARVVAVDLAEGMIAVTRERAGEAGLANVAVAAHAAERLPFADASFDLVTCRIAPHHFLDVAAATREVARVLRPGGRYVLEDSMAPDDAVAAAFLHEVESLRDPTHVRSLSRGEWVGECARAGLSVASVEVIRKTHDFDAWLRRGGAPADAMASVRDLFASAPAEARSHLAIESGPGGVERFTDDKVLLVARR